MRPNRVECASQPGRPAYLKPLLDALYECGAICLESDDGDDYIVGELKRLAGIARLDRVSLRLASVAGDDGKPVGRDSQNSSSVVLHETT